MLNYFWSDFRRYLTCREQFRLSKVCGLPFEFVGIEAKIEEGIDIHEALGARLVNLTGFRAGNTKLLKLYHELYRVEDERLAPWLVESKFEPVELLPGVFIAAKVDAYSASCGGFVGEGLVRDTKRKGRRGYLAVDVAQLIWYCRVVGTNRAQLDLIYPPSWERSEWGLERIDYEFKDEHFDWLKQAVQTFHHWRQGQSPETPAERNPNSCGYCCYTQRCWPGLAVT